MKNNNIDCFRVYDREIPSYPFIVDIYGDSFVIYERFNDKIDKNPEQKRQEIKSVITELFDLQKHQIIFKNREIQKGLDQYNKISKKGKTKVVQEKDAKIIVNLYDYLDTGLFLDHRPLRLSLNKTAKDKNLLNLFSYTSVVGLQAALGGATTTNVDLSKTYINWSIDNYHINDLDLEKHKFINGDVIEYLKNENKKFDIIFCDPPTFSNSKKFEGVFNVQRDHEKLIQLCMNLLKDDGILYFSNNNRKFKLSKYIENKFDCIDTSHKTVPSDFHDKKIHKSFKIVLKN